MRPRNVGAPPTIKSVEKAARLLAHMATVGQPIGVHDLARALHLDPSTTYRLLRSLETHGFVEQDLGSGPYRLGTMTLRLGAAFLQSVELRALARPWLERLAEQSQETVHLMIPDGEMGIYLDRVEGPQRVRVASSVGQREYLHCGAVGKAILAFLPQSQVARIFATVGLPGITAQTITSPSKLRTSLQDIRRRGYSIDNGEGNDGVRCAGAPILGDGGRVIGALSIAAPAYRVDFTRLHGKFGPLVASAAADISGALGYRKEGAVSAGA